MEIEHVVVLMLENRSFDCMLGVLYPKSAAFDGLSGTEMNIWHKPDRTQEIITVWNDPTVTATSVCIPDPDPGELFDDINMQIHGLAADGTPNPGPPEMGGFVDNYMRQPETTPPPDPRAVMHYFTPDQVPVISQLARAFGVSDRWHASAPCQTWPNRFFVHTGTANGYVNNSPPHFPYEMNTVYGRLSEVGQTWKIYFHDMPQSVTLANLWDVALTHFEHYEGNFAADAAAGSLPTYSFIEPRYFTDEALSAIPNDGHPPHNVAYGEQLVASVYNAVRSGPGWKKTLLVITYDEHGGCYDHVVPPAATPPGGGNPDGYDFSQFGVRVPAVIVSPYVAAGSILRPDGPVPFDHTSIIATLRTLFGIGPLTPRDEAAPNLIDLLTADPENDGPASVTAAPVPVPPQEAVAAAAARPPNALQQSLAEAAQMLPTLGADVATHIEGLLAVPGVASEFAYATVASAASDVESGMGSFLGRL